MTASTITVTVRFARWRVRAAIVAVWLWSLLDHTAAEERSFVAHLSVFLERGLRVNR